MPTTIEDRILCDTNIVSRFVLPSDPQHALVVQSVVSLRNAGCVLLYAPQAIREFWNYATRPGDKNGLGLTVVQADEAVLAIEGAFEILHDTPEMHALWRRLVVDHEVRGVQVHDARLAASALAGGCRAILTLNDADFRRYGAAPLHPSGAPASAANAEPQTP